MNIGYVKRIDTAEVFAYISGMAKSIEKRTSISFTREDLRNLAKLQKREGITSVAGVIRWAVVQALKG